MDFPDDLAYTRDHEWLRLEGETGTAGITDYAQRELTDIVFVEFVEPGTVVRQGERFGTVEAIKAVSDLFSPADGEIVEVNAELATHPEWINQDPYGKGWMVKIRVNDPAQVHTLLSAADYRTLVANG
ncbi:MAG: Glycine cleavage system H protein [Candidatus Latescibacteria bacterium ADurb.Bin168]|nr:MAG: Glycine cleavage system H protein [Candidatus Latescibacteria bacterium ADurb.Bin168]